MKSIISIFLLFFYLNVVSQSFSKSESFDIKYNPKIKLLQLSNKSTFFIEEVEKEGLNLKIYNESRKVVKSEKLNLKFIPDVGNFSSGIKTLFEINNETVLFYKRTDRANHKLVRVIINSITGNQIREEVIAELTGNEYETFFEVVKDPDSEYYAVFMINFKTGIEVLHFNPEHKVINKINYTNPSKDYKFFKPIDYYVHKGEFVLIASKVLNTDPINMAYVTINPKETLKYFISKSNNGDKNFINQELSYTSDKKSSIDVEILYNTKFDIVHLLAYKTTDGNRSNHQEVSFTNIIASNFNGIKAPIKIDSSELINYYKNKLGRKKEYNAILRSWNIDASGNISLLFNNITSTAECINFGDIGILKLNADGKIIKSYIFPYDYYKCISSANANAFYSNGLFFTSTEKSSYLLLNNVKENMGLDDKKETYEIKALQKTVSLKYTINDATSKIEFTEPNSETEFNSFFYEISNYNKNLKTYCAISNDVKAKKSSVVWLKLD